MGTQLCFTNRRGNRTSFGRSRLRSAGTCACAMACVITILAVSPAHLGLVSFVLGVATDARTVGNHNSAKVVRQAEGDQPLDNIQKTLKDTFKIKGETRIEGAEIETPLERLFRFGGKQEKASDEDFIDSSDELNYVTVSLEKPLGLGIGESTPDGGAMITELQPGSVAEQSGRVKPGYHLIAISGQPVHGLKVEEVIEQIKAKEGAMSLTFFAGDAKFFYGNLGPSRDWLSDFLSKVQA